MKGSMIVTNSKKCTYLVFMLLLLISTFTMSIETTNIMCIHWKVYPTCKEDYLTNCARKRIDHCVTSQEFVMTQRWKEILKVVVPPLEYTSKWISENQVNQNDVSCVASQTIQKIMLPPCRLKPTMLSLCHIVF